MEVPPGLEPILLLVADRTLHQLAHPQQLLLVRLRLGVYAHLVQLQAGRVQLQPVEVPVEPSEVRLGGRVPRARSQVGAPVWLLLLLVLLLLELLFSIAVLPTRFLLYSILGSLAYMVDRSSDSQTLAKDTRVQLLRHDLPL